MLAAAISSATTESWRTATTIREVREKWGAAVGGTRPGTLPHRLLDLLTEEPIINADLVVERIGAGEDDARRAIAALLDAGVLTRAPRSRRAPVWLAPAILDEVHDLSLRIRASTTRNRVG